MSDEKIELPMKPVVDHFFDIPDELSEKHIEKLKQAGRVGIADTNQNDES